MTTVRELYEDSIHYGEKVLAHYILHLLQEGHVSLNDDASLIDFSLVDQKKVTEMIQKNQLGFSDIKVFSLKWDDKTFAFIFAANEEEAKKHFEQQLGSKPLNCFEYPLDFPMSRGNEFLSFRDMKKEYSTFPAIAGFYERDENYGPR
ncbi:hypothetical protein M670_00162 [Schinkia azotoformans MEV2011]|uniref:Uncharacterized protein n=1 Tax=Schinkia azotoformans MEV2011 TaxID=1348973 RepID=A0A072NRT5_SCHAZ|nr:hypothetical protein [Schinkia azotoformans]KEF40146.1 hypothetical protein M670_00162 [Schinkia azotoformans MEV2011]